MKHSKVDSEWRTADEYLRIVLNEAIEMMDLIISMSLMSLTVLIFTLGYYCINKARKEGPLIAKVRNLLNADKTRRKVSRHFRTLWDFLDLRTFESFSLLL